MAVYYADTSVILKRHVQELGTQWFRQLIVQRESVVVTCRLAIVKACSAFNRRKREGNIADSAYMDLWSEFLHVCSTEYELIELSERLTQTACRLLKTHSLRASDALHLAAALAANDALTAADVPPLIFLAADERLLSAAVAEGLHAINLASGADEQES